MRTRLLAPLRLAAWTAALVVVGRLLVAAGSGTLSVPLTSLDDLSVWVSETPPADMAIALLRLAGLAAVAYLLAATVLVVVAHLARVRPLLAAAEILSPEIVRRLATGGSGLGLVLGGAVAAVPVPDLPPGRTGEPVAVAATPPGPHGVTDPSHATMARLPDATATMARVDGEAGSASVASPPGATATMARIDVEARSASVASPPDAVIPDPARTTNDATATMLRVDEPAPPSATMRPVDAPPAVAPPPAATPAAPTTTAPGAAVAVTPATLEVDPTRWVVEPGDSLWSIAEDVTSPAGGPPPAEREVTRYWQRLVAANRPHLVDPDNPDLLVPGQQVVLPSFGG